MHAPDLMDAGGLLPVEVTGQHGDRSDWASMHSREENAQCCWSVLPHNRHKPDQLHSRALRSFGSEFSSYTTRTCPYGVGGLGEVEVVQQLQGRLARSR